MIAIIQKPSNYEKMIVRTLQPYILSKDTIGSRTVTIYTLNPGYRFLFSTIIKHLQKKHTSLFFAEESEPHLPLTSSQVYPYLNEIFTLTNCGIPRKFAILFEKEEESLHQLFQALSPFAQSVSLVPNCPSDTEKLTQEALQTFGLTVNERSISQLDGIDITLYLSGNFDLSKLHCGKLINLTDREITSPIPTLFDLTSKETQSFFARHPNLRLKHCLLLPEHTKITGLVWTLH